MLWGVLRPVLDETLKARTAQESFDELGQQPDINLGEPLSIKSNVSSIYSDPKTLSAKAIKTFEPPIRECMKCGELLGTSSRSTRRVNWFRESGVEGALYVTGKCRG